ncbi:MAG: (2Fe-2S)-binding protein [Tistrella sp.]|uniref:(2Fe-2S)-binding protein n=1 Tax=Tistrella sp. TaxID=2024861 RepID=UPI000C4DBFDA|nr:(2Fe-2S)-binding protein [Tistrella sp.]MAD36261.1 (2Fe-2S)-binding protein [Tistrella sp.]MBA76552.1 (2Fe-2S)-binding protein [Tistrella sp.]MBA78749.1 (2Fe-2S)-binding protein [Tistrella sp.]
MPGDRLVEGRAVTLEVNGHPCRVTIDPRLSLLDLLRDRLGLTGAKKGCDHGQCGACTLLVDGRAVLGCLTLAARLDGARVTSIEGLTPEGEEEGEGAGALHPMQQAFIDHDAFQCGYCTPGQILSAVALTAAEPQPDDARIREHMSGNLCRCAAYPNIVAAVRAAAGRMGGA